MRHRWLLLLLASGIAAAGCLDQPTGGTDREPPAAVWDLVASRPIDTTLQLSWSPSGDDGGSGAAALCEIRYSTADLAQDRALISAFSLFVPASPPGSGRQQIGIGDLQRGRLYFFRVRTADEVPNWSPWSNVASSPTVNTPPEPRFSLQSDTLVVGDTLEVDASASRDSESGDTLVTRWDWDGNGSWDEDWSCTPVARHAVARPGSYAVRLQVRDQAGATAETEHAVAVIVHACRSQETEVEAHVYGDCCSFPQHCLRCDALKRDSSSKCGDASTAATVEYAYGEAQVQQSVRGAPDSLRVVAVLSTRSVARATGTTHSRFATEIEVLIPTSFAVQARLSPGSTTVTGVWRLRFSGPSGDIVSHVQGCSPPLGLRRIGTLEPGIYALEAIVDVGQTSALQVTFELLLGIDLPPLEALR